jgi:hypothetical protein
LIFFVMAGRRPGHPTATTKKDVDAQHKAGHDIKRPLFQDGPKDQTRNLEIRGSLALLAPRNDERGFI